MLLERQDCQSRPIVLSERGLLERLSRARFHKFSGVPPLRIDLRSLMWCRRYPLLPWRFIDSCGSRIIIVWFAIKVPPDLVVFASFCFSSSASFPLAL